MFGTGWAKIFDQYFQSARVVKMVRYRFFFCGNFQLSLNNNQVVFLHQTAFLTLLLTLLSLDISYSLRKSLYSYMGTYGRYTSTVTDG